MQHLIVLGRHFAIPLVVFLVFSIVGAGQDGASIATSTALAVIFSLPMFALAIASLGDLVLRGRLEIGDRARACFRSQVITAMILVLSIMMAFIVTGPDVSNAVATGVMFGALAASTVASAYVFKTELYRQSGALSAGALASDADEPVDVAGPDEQSQ